MTYQQAGCCFEKDFGLGDFYTCIDLYIDFFAEIYEYPAGKPGRH